VQITAEFTNSRKFTITTNLPDPKFFEPFLTVGNHELIGPPVTMNVSEHDISVSPQVLVDQFEIGEGTWTFDQVEPVAGAPITGSFQGTLYRRVP
jgi:hypothetical protein